jgi:hypothetical protein
MAEIRRREAEEAPSPEPRKLKAGALVRIREGPLDERIDLCTSARANTVMVLLSMFGTERKIRFSRAAIEAV